MFSKKPEPSRPGASHSTAKTATFSVIAADVVIRGNIEAATDLHIDGTIEGDIACASLVQGEGSRILGAITCASARLGGTVGGTITVGELAILRSARIEGDVHYATLTVEQRAGVHGRLAPDAASAPSQAAADEPGGMGAGMGGDTEPRLTLAC